MFHLFRWWLNTSKLAKVVNLIFCSSSAILEQEQDRCEKIYHHKNCQIERHNGEEKSYFIFLDLHVHWDYNMKSKNSKLDIQPYKIFKCISNK